MKLSKRAKLGGNGNENYTDERERVQNVTCLKQARLRVSGRLSYCSNLADIQGHKTVASTAAAGGFQRTWLHQPQLAGQTRRVELVESGGQDAGPAGSKVRQAGAVPGPCSSSSVHSSSPWISREPFECLWVQCICPVPSSLSRMQTTDPFSSSHQKCAPPPAPLSHCPAALPLSPPSQAAPHLLIICGMHGSHSVSGNSV